MREDKKYIFQRKKVSFTKRAFTKGLSIAGMLLLHIKESGEIALESLPSSYPEFDLMKKLVGVGPYRYLKAQEKKLEFNKKTLQNNITKLKKLGLVIKDPERKVLCLTNEGERFVAYIEDRYEVLSKNWDEKVRVVIFDIPEKKRKWREWLRSELSLLQYKALQKSVYIGKTPLPQGFYQEIIEAGLGKYVFIFTMADFDREQVAEILEEVE